MFWSIVRQSHLRLTLIHRIQRFSLSSQLVGVAMQCLPHFCPAENSDCLIAIAANGRRNHGWSVDDCGVKGEKTNNNETEKNPNWKCRMLLVFVLAVELVTVRCARFVSSTHTHTLHVAFCGRKIYKNQRPLQWTEAIPHTDARVIKIISNIIRSTFIHNKHFPFVSYFVSHLVCRTVIV